MDEKQNLSIREYELCQRATETVENRIWNTFAAMGIATLGALSAATFGKADLPALAVIAVMNVVAIWTWWGMASRWWDIQHITFARMSHIEDDIGFFQMKYINYKDSIIDLGTSRLKLEYLKELRTFLYKEQIEILRSNLSQGEQYELDIERSPVETIASKLLHKHVYKLSKHDILQVFEGRSVELDKEQIKNIKSHLRYLKRGVKRSLRWFPWIVTLTWAGMLAYSFYKALEC
jgi:hypothetical protein